MVPYPIITWKMFLWKIKSRLRNVIIFFLSWDIFLKWAYKTFQIIYTPFSFRMLFNWSLKMFSWKIEARPLVLVYDKNHVIKESLLLFYFDFPENHVINVNTSFCTCLKWLVNEPNTYFKSFLIVLIKLITIYCFYY